MSDSSFKEIPKPLNLGVGAMSINHSKTNWLPNKMVTSKYNIITFLPFNFFHQIRKGSTFFFFITLVLLSIPRISPFEPYTYLFAFFIVVGVSMIKDAMEDYKRHADDNQVNNALVHVLTCFETENNECKMIASEKKCMELHPGDFILMKRNQEVYADVVFLRSKIFNKNKYQCINHCFVQTSNLDGESNLKRKNAFENPPNSYSCCTASEHHSHGVDDAISPCYEYFFKTIRSFELKDTGDSFDTFECSLNIDGELALANEKNVIFCGSTLKNTESALGLVVGVGANTKLLKSLDKTKRTKSLYDNKMNHFLVVVLWLYAFMMAVTIIFGTVFLAVNKDLKYLNISSFAYSLVTSIFSNYILYIYLIPLSLYVMLELARFVHSAYISNDQEMVVDGVRSKCRNSSVIEDLGAIDYILTDKTGTITQNSMTFRLIHAGESKELISPDQFLDTIKQTILSNKALSIKEKVRSILDTNDSNKDNLLFLINMLVCNSVEIVNRSCESVSQEELCFLATTTKKGFSLYERAEDNVVVDILGEKIDIEIIGTREFASKLQRMDVVVKFFDKTFLLAKGSDQKLLNYEKDREKLDLINKSNNFRSLVFKYKEMSIHEVDEFYKYTTVNSQPLNLRNRSITTNTSTASVKKHNEHQIFDELESKSHYLGSVFIEDEMQEEVVETMKMLKDSGIKVWMVTGDKKETAVACARSSSLIEGNDFVALSGIEALESIENSIKMERSTNNSIYNCYQTTGQEIDNQMNESIFDKKCIVIYRATPNQKGQIASRLVRSGRHTLAIGDGNNDIGMLKASNVGIGVIGKEGNQAAMSGDFSIPQFKLLKRLLLIHGRYCLQRYTKITINSYYKNIVFIFVQFIYNLYSGASGRPLYSSIIFNYYNLFFTSMIPFSISLFDKDMDQASVLSRPETYKHARLYFDKMFVYANVSFAICEATVIFFLIKLFLINEIANADGIITGFTTISIVYATAIIFAVLLRQIRSVSFRVIFTDISIVVSIVLNLIMIIWVQEISGSNTNAIFYLLGCPYFYFVLFSVVSTIYVVDTIFEHVNYYLLEKLKNEK